MQKTLFSQDYQKFLSLLKLIRAEAGITQEQIADSMQVTQSFISKCERGERRVDIVELKVWCKAIGISLSDFVINFEKLTEERT